MSNRKSCCRQWQYYCFVRRMILLSEKGSSPFVNSDYSFFWDSHNQYSRKHTEKNSVGSNEKLRNSSCLELRVREATVIGREHTRARRKWGSREETMESAMPRWQEGSPLAPCQLEGVLVLGFTVEGEGEGRKGWCYLCQLTAAINTM